MFVYEHDSMLHENYFESFPTPHPPKLYHNYSYCQRIYNSIIKKLLLDLYKLPIKILLLKLFSVSCLRIVFLQHNCGHTFYQYDNFLDDFI